MNQFIVTQVEEHKDDLLRSVQVTLIGTGPFDTDELRDLFGQLVTISKSAPLEAT